MLLSRIWRTECWTLSGRRGAAGIGYQTEVAEGPTAGFIIQVSFLVGTFVHRKGSSAHGCKIRSLEWIEVKWRIRGSEMAEVIRKLRKMAARRLGLVVAAGESAGRTMPRRDPSLSFACPFVPHCHRLRPRRRCRRPRRPPGPLPPPSPPPCRSRHALPSHVRGARPHALFPRALFLPVAPSRPRCRLVRRRPLL